jgi:hypothetical protein
MYKSIVVFMQRDSSVRAGVQKFKRRFVQVNNMNAIFNWRPPVTQADTTNAFTITVADDGTPNLSATRSFTITVNLLTPPSASSAVWSNGQFVLQVTNNMVGPDYAVEASTNLFDWNTLWTTNSPAMPFRWVDANAGAPPVRFYRIQAGLPLP